MKKFKMMALAALTTICLTASPVMAEETINVNNTNGLSFNFIEYQTHVQNVGWQDIVADGNGSGTSGQGLRLEGIKISSGVMLSNTDVGIRYRTHVQNLGWQDWVSDGEMSGTEGLGYRLEAIEIELTGEDAELYDVYYRVHAENFGNLDWAKNGETSGSAGYGYRLEQIWIEIVEKGETPSNWSVYGEGQDPSREAFYDYDVDGGIENIVYDQNDPTGLIDKTGSDGEQIFVPN